MSGHSTDSSETSGSSGKIFISLDGRRMSVSGHFSDSGGKKSPFQVDFVADWRRVERGSIAADVGFAQEI